MAKDDPVANATDFPPTPETATTFQLMLDEFCSRLSQSDRRVEMISAFHHAETQAGRLKDTDAAFAARYSAFVNQPA